MNTAATLTSYGSVKLSEEDQIKQHEELIKELNDPYTIENFIKECKKVGQTALAIDHDFVRVKVGLADLIKKYGKDFPKIESEYAPRWDAFMTMSQHSSFLSPLNNSAKTANTLAGYGVILQLVSQIATEKDLKEAQAVLGEYIDSHSVEVAKTVADEIVYFKRDIQEFLEDITKYIGEKQNLTEQAKEYAADIMNSQAEVDKLNAMIGQMLTALGCASVFGIAFVINPCFLIHYFVQSSNACKEAQDNLDKAQANLGGVKDQQNALGAIQVDFEEFKPNINDICLKLVIFANIFHFMTEESIQIKEELDKGMELLTKKRFKLLLELLQSQIKPLQEGMKVYADQIVRPSEFSK